MKPLDVHPMKDRKPSTGKQDPTTARSGEGAASALEQLIYQRRVRWLHLPQESKEAPRREPAGVCHCGPDRSPSRAALRSGCG